MTVSRRIEGPRLIVALDFPDAHQALEFVDRLDFSLCRLKVGKELFTRSGPALIEKLTAAGFETFLDLKFHDIPNTVARACSAAADLGVWMMNVHALGGRHMLEAARQALETGRGPRPLLIAVTILTSLDQADLAEIGLSHSPGELVKKLAILTRDCGLDGVVCSPQEAHELKSTLGRDFLLVTPGIRSPGSDAGDQKRIMTPADAIRAGSDYLVVGRPVTQAANPLAVLQELTRQISDLT
jgi:orotidine-5'-phosphate decarboxylase